jgi:hypothetical protein
MTDEGKMVVGVLACLRLGLGVEDMQARGICDADFARGVICKLRRMGELHQFIGVKKRRSKRLPPRPPVRRTT